MRVQRFVVALMLFLTVGPGMASLIESRQILTFDLPSIQYIHYAPLTPETMSLTNHKQALPLQFAGFDSSLGTLKNAYLSYEDTHAIQYFVKAGTRPPAWYESVVYGGTVAGLAYYKYLFGLTATGVNGPMGATLHSDTMTTQAYGHRYSGLSYLNFDGSGPKDPDGDITIDGVYLWQPWVTAGDLDVPLLSMADGLDVLGTAVDIMLTKDITVYMAPFFSSFGDPDFSFVQNDLNAWSGRLALTFVYETGGPAPVSEPPLLLLTCTGLLALVLGRRRQGQLGGMEPCGAGPIDFGRRFGRI